MSISCLLTNRAFTLRYPWAAVLTVGLLLLVASACDSHPHREKGPISSVPIAEADSLSITTTFDTALRNPSEADSLIGAARALANEKPELQDLYNAGYGRFLILTGQLDDAEKHVSTTIGAYGDDTLHYNLAKYHNLMAAIKAYNKEHEASVYHFKQAINVYEQHRDDRQASIIKFNLANVFFGRLDYEAAYQYSNEALAPLEASKDTANLILCLSVLSVAETNRANIQEAEGHARYALDLADKHPSLQGKLFSNYAMGEAELAQGNYDASIARLRQTIELGESQQMFQWLLPVRAALLKAYLSAGNYRAAIGVGETLVEQAAQFGNRDIMYSAFKNLAFAQENIGQYSHAYENLKKAEELFREHMSETTERVLQETRVKYETEKKNNIILQQENKLSRQQMWNAIVVGSALLGILILTGFWKNVQQKNRLLVKEKENAVYYAINEGEERERNRLAGELHDGIASNLVAIKLRLENSYPANAIAEDLLPLVSKTHQEIRHAAHNLAPLNFERQTLASAMQAFVSECSHEGCTVTFQANEEAKKMRLHKQMTLICFRATQELIQNALKHAEASSIFVQLMLQDERLQITVEDDGVGFDPAIIDSPQGRGLSNLVNRLDKIGGSIDIESRPQSGTTIFIHIQAHQI